MDNGRNRVDRSMVGTGVQPDPVRLWWAGLEDGAVRSTEISGLPYGTESNPPAWDPARGIVVAYDAGNAVVRAWRMEGDDLVPLWRRDGLAHAGHLILYPDTRELVVGDWKESEALRRPGIRPAFRTAGSLLSGPPACAEPRYGRATTNWSCSTSIRAGRRLASTSHPRPRASSSPPPASVATSTTSR